MIYKCKECGKEFKSSPSNERIYCSRKCSDGSKERGDKISKSKMGHAVSEEQKESQRKIMTGRHCSEEHKEKMRKIMKGKSTSWLKGRKQSAETIRKRVEKISGEKHYKWIIDRTKLLDQRNTIEDDKWGRAIRKRDNYICQCCKAKGKKIQAHHIWSQTLFPHLRYELNNGITLCEDCHKFFTKQQIQNKYLFQ